MRFYLVIRRFIVNKIIVFVLLATLSVNWNPVIAQSDESSSAGQTMNIDETRTYKLRDFMGEYEEVSSGHFSFDTDYYEPSYEDVEGSYPKLLEFLEDHERELEEVDEYVGEREIKETIIYNSGRPISPVTIESTVPLFLVEEYSNDTMFYLFEGNYLYGIRYELSYNIESYIVTKYERKSDTTDEIEANNDVPYGDILVLDFENNHNFHYFTGIVELYEENTELGYAFAHVASEDNEHQKYLVGWPYLPEQEIEEGDTIRFTGQVNATTEVTFEDGSMIVPILDVIYIDGVE